MYSVIRFSGPAAILESLGSKINYITPGMFTGLDRVQDRFSLSIAESDVPSGHITEILAAIQKLREVILRSECTERLCFHRFVSLSR